MGKILSILIFGMILMAVSGVIAQSALSEDVEDFVKKVAEKKGINGADIKSVEEVDFNNLPKEIKFENIDDTNLAIYQINTTDQPVFIISASGKNIQKIIKQEIYTTSLLNFGINGEANDSVFMDTATGIKSGLNKGYVMMKDGSITGISTSMEVLEEWPGPIEVIIYLNGEEAGFRNSIDTSLTGIKKDYAIQSRGVVTFKPGDVISAYANSNGAKFKDAVTLIEITS